MLIKKEELQTINFHGNDLCAFMDSNNTIWVKAKEIANVLEIGWGRQLQRITDDPSLNQYCKHMLIVYEHPKNPEKILTRKELFITAEGISLWLTKINPRKIKDSVKRERLILYQTEAAKVLYQHFFTKQSSVNSGILVELLDVGKAILNKLDVLLGKNTNKKVSRLLISEFLSFKLNKTPTPKECMSFGVLAKKKYFEKFGRYPEKEVITKNGNTYTRNIYYMDDVKFLEEVFSEWKSNNLKIVPIRTLKRSANV